MPMTAIPGTYAIRFTGFNRQDKGSGRARHLVGVGILTLGAVTDDTGNVDGEHHSTNVPITDATDQDSMVHVHHTEYTLKGTYKVLRSKPMFLLVEMEFKKNNTVIMTDTFKAVQNGLNSFWLITTDPQFANKTKKVDELVMGEAVKVADDW